MEIWKRVALLAGASLLLAPLPDSRQVVSTQAASPPILLVLNDSAANRFGGYLAEILRAEGLPTFATAQVSTVTDTQLSAAQLVILAETPLTSQQASRFTQYVTGGGRLIAMRPAAQLASTLGLAPAGGSVSDGYIGINTGNPTGAGLPSTTLPFRGTADRYNLAGATTLATLYTDRTTASPYPAVAASGATVTWTFDLARSIAYTRQGNPALAGQDLDGEPPLRSADIFFEGIDLDRVRIPHADFMMRLFSRTIQDLLADEFPLPRLWYFPADKRTLMILTSDTHQPTAAQTAELIDAAEARGGRVSTYLPRFTLTEAGPELDAWRAAGHEFGVHPYGYMDAVSIDAGFTTNENWFDMHSLGVPSRTARNHQIEWQGWVDAALVEAAHGIALDANYYTWGPAVQYPDLLPNGRRRQAHGFITGSGLPMRFVNTNGAIVPVYQQVTSLIDEQLVYSDFSEGLTPGQALAVSRQLIDDSQAGGYSALMTQFHADYYPFGEVRPWADGTMDYAASLTIPMWTSERWLRYIEARAATVFGVPTWSAVSRELAFTVTVPTGAESQSVIVPATYAGRLVSNVRVSGSTVPFSTQTIGGRSTVFFAVPHQNGAARPVLVTYNATQPNQPPLAGADNASTPQNTAVTISVLANDSDPEGQPLTVISVTTPARGTTAILSGGTTVRYTPTTGTCGTDNFSYTISDGQGGTAVGAVSVTVACPANSPPVAVDDTATTPFNTPVSIAVLANDSDPNADPLTVTIAGGATRGTVAIAPGGTGVTYTPTSGLCGADSFTYTVNDGRGGTDTGTVSVTVGCTGARIQTTVADFTNCLSTLTGTQVTAAGDGEIRLAGGFSDTFTAATLGSQWTAGTWAGGAYTPTIASGVMSLSGTSGAFVRSTATTTVSTLDTRARISNASWQHLGWGSLDFAGDQYLMFSTYNQSARLFARSNLGGGESQTDLGPIPAGFHTYRVERVTIAATERIRYLIDGVFVAEHVLTGTVPAMHVYLSHNSQTASPTLDVDSISVSPPYVASGTFDSCPIDGGTSVTWTTASWTGSAPTGSSFNVRTRTSPDATAWSAWSTPIPASGGAITSPAGHYVQYRLELATTVNTTSPVIEAMSLEFVPSAGAPVAVDDTATTPFNTPVSIPVLTNDSDPQGDPIAVTAVGAPGRGTAAITGGGTSVFYTPTTGLCGPDAFSYTIGDGQGGSASAQVTVSVTCPANIPPVAVDDTATTGFGTPVSIGVLANDSDGNGDPLTVSAVTQPTRGSVTIAPGGTSVTYTPMAVLCGPDSFTYTVSDGQGGTDTATVSVTVGCAGGHTHTTFADFASCGSISAGTQVTNIAGGEVRLGGAFGDDYASGTLGPQWTAGTWAGGPYTPTFNAGVISLGGAAGAWVRSATTMPVTALEARAQIPAATWQHLGWAVQDFASDHYLLFSTFNQSGRLLARSNLAAGEIQTDLGPVPTGFHVYRIERTTAPDSTEHIRYLIDGAVVAEHVLTGAVPAMHVYQSHNSQAATPTLDVDSIAVSPPYAPGGTFDSCPIDNGTSVGWTTISWAGTVPPSTALAVRTRTSTDGVTWSAWSAPIATSGGAITSPAGRYAQYQLQLSSTDVALSPVIESVTLETDGSGTVLPTLSIGNATVTEGNTGGTTIASFPVTLSAASDATVTVAYATSNGTATSGSDYQPASGTLTFAPGETTRSIPVTVIGDNVDEPDETFNVALSAPSNATIAAGNAVGTIVDNDLPLPTLSIGNASLTEGNTGSANMTFTVTLSAAATQTVTVGYSTTNGTATAGSDYQAVSGTVTFTTGQSSRPITVPITGDLADEPNETFNVVLASPVNATIAQGTGVGTIVDNDPPLPALSINNPTVNEGNSGSANMTFTVTLSAASAQTVTVAYATSNGTATAGSDFTNRNGTLSFTPGALTRTFTVPITGDTRDEPNETFIVTLSGATNATVATPTGTGTINDNDAAPTISVNNIFVTEPSSGSTNARFTVTLSVVSGRVVTVNYATANGSATSASGDYTPTSGTLTFQPGVRTMTVDVPVLFNNPNESFENFLLNLSAPVNATFGDNSATCTIFDF